MGGEEGQNGGRRARVMKEITKLIGFHFNSFKAFFFLFCGR